MSDVQECSLEFQPSNDVGVLDARFDREQPLVHFRGIKYASISERFAAPVLVNRHRGETLRATQFGPRCPQIPVDVRDLMQIPKALECFPPETEDEFECLNLNITAPAKNDKKLPVLIWIYGGALVVSFSSPAQRLCETGPFVAQSIASGEPIVLVTPNHRLNLLAYGDGTESGERNLHVQDLQAAVKWTIHNIGDFGGDTSRISIAGESAGSILTHALCLTLPPPISIYRAVLCSGSLGSSRFQPASFLASTLSRILTTAKALAVQQGHPSANDLTLRTLPIPLLVASMAANALNSIPLQESPHIPSDRTPPAAFSRLNALMLGDCEFEGILWLAGIRLIPSTSIREVFTGDQPSEATLRLASSYLDQPNISTGHDSLGITGPQAAALSFMADYLFHLPNHEIIASLTSSPSSSTSNSSRAQSTTPPQVYTYLFDQPNPFSTAPPQPTKPKPAQGVPRAHHGVDLLALWNGYGSDYPANSPFAAVAEAYRAKILAFVNGHEPWSPVASPSVASSSPTAAEPEKGTEAYAYAFGPEGQHGEITAQEYAGRRRVEAMKVMREVGQGVIDGVFGRLMGEIGAAVGRALKEVGVQGVQGVQGGAAAAATGGDGGEQGKKSDAVGEETNTGKTGEGSGNGGPRL